MSKNQAKAAVSMRTVLISIFLVVIVVVAGAGLAFSILSATGLVPPDGSTFEIRAGDDGATIAANLEQQGLIRSATAFKVLLRFSGASSNLQMGNYLIKPGMGSVAIMKLLQTGKQLLVRVTLPEGYTIKEVARRFGAQGIAPEDEIVRLAYDPKFVASLSWPQSLHGFTPVSLEGLLFPDTYFFPKNYGAQRLLTALVKTFFIQMDKELPQYKNLTPQEFKNILTLASIVEREYQRPEEAPTIASVFYNRLRIRMPLQSCATVVYLITEQEGRPHPKVIYNRDLERVSPYNTYKVGGLPPGPIASPGMVALKAAFQPAISDYLYFRLVDPAKGQHQFSRTLAEHLAIGDRLRREGKIASDLSIKWFED